MQFRVLGPLEVLDSAGTPRALNGAKERALVAALLLDPGEVVSNDRLIDLLWPDESPANPANALQARVSALRRSIGEPGVIITRAPGYCIDIAQHEVDARQFERLVDQARRATTRDESLDLYERALALWRGSPFSEFVYSDFARPEIRRLEELNLSAMEERIQTMLELGRHVEVLGQLEGLVLAHPLRERLWGMLMLALYRAGRQADALRAYRQASSILGEELGIEPSTELRELEEAILTQSPSLVGPPNSVTVPKHNLPARLTSLIGRSVDVERVTTLLEEHRLITLTGPGGVGKTSLAIACGEGVVTRFSDGVWLVELASINDTGLVPMEIARSLGLEIGDRSTIELVCEVLADRSLLIVLDNCEHLIEAVARASLAILQRSPGVRMVATSREPLGVPGEILWPTRPLSTPPAMTDDRVVDTYDAVQLFVDRASRARPDLVLDEEALESVAEICRRLDGLPLAIELAAARVRSLPVDEIAVRLDDRFGLLTGSSRTVLPRQLTLDATIAWSYDLLSDQDKDLFRRLSVFAGGWSLEAAAAVSGAGDVLGLLTRLVDRSLIVTDHSPAVARYRMLETIRAFAARELADSGAGPEAALAHAGWFTELAESADFEGPDQAKWADVLSTEYENLREALDRANDRGDRSIALRLGSALGWLWFFGNRDEGRTSLDRLLDTTESFRGPERVSALLARARLDMFGPTTRSLYSAREAMSLARSAGLKILEARAKVLVALAGSSEPDVQSSIQLTKEAGSVFSEHGDIWGQAFASFWRMELIAHSGHLSTAIEEGGNALSLFRRTGDPWAISATLAHLGKLGRFAGRVDWANETCSEALQLAEDRVLPHTIQYVMTHLGYLCLLANDTTGALELFSEAMEIATDIGNRVGVAANANGLAETHATGRSLKQAEHLHLQALTEFESLGLSTDMAYTSTRIGLNDELAGRWEAAALRHRDALMSVRSTGDVMTMIPCLEGLGRVAVGRGDSSEAALLLRAGSSLRARTGLAELPLEAEANRSSRAVLRSVMMPEELEQICGVVDSMEPDAILPLIGDVVPLRGTALHQIGFKLKDPRSSHLRPVANPP